METTSISAEQLKVILSHCLDLGPVDREVWQSLHDQSHLAVGFIGTVLSTDFRDFDLVLSVHGLEKNNAVLINRSWAALPLESPDHYMTQPWNQATLVYGDAIVMNETPGIQIRGAKIVDPALRHELTQHSSKKTCFQFSTAYPQKFYMYAGLLSTDDCAVQ